MRISRLLAALSTLLLAGLPVALSAQSFDLEFDWPTGSAQVDISVSTDVVAAGQPNSSTSKMSYRLSVTEAEGGLRLSYSDFTFDGTGMEALIAAASPGEDLSQAMSSVEPDILVTRDGDFSGLADYEALRTSLEEMMAPMREQMAAQGMAEMFDEMIGSSISRETPTLQAEQGWNQMGGYWAGRTMQAGEPVTVTSQMPMPMSGGESLEVQTELRVVGRVPCSEGAAGEDCLELASDATPDAEEVRNMMDVFMADMMERAGGTGMEMFINALTLDTGTTLVVEAETLRPVRMETVVDMTMEMDLMGNTQSVENHQVVEARFDWGS